MINLGVGEFYVKMTIDGESYDPFSAETLRVLPATHPSYRVEVIAASRRKYAIPAGDAQRLIAEEESTIIRSAQEKAAITRGSKSEEDAKDSTESTEPKTETASEPLI